MTALRAPSVGLSELPMMVEDQAGMSSPHSFLVPPGLPGAAHPTLSFHRGPSSPAIRIVRCDSSQVFRSAQVCPSTKPHAPVTSTMRSNERCGSQISSSHCRFRLFAWVVSVKETEERVPGSNIFIGRERVAAALLIASEAACSSKASRADARMMKRLASSSPSSTTFGWGTTSPVFHQLSVDLHLLAKKLVFVCPTSLLFDSARGHPRS